MTSARIVSFLGIIVLSLAAALLEFSFFPALLGIAPDLLFVLFFCIIFFADSASEKITVVIIAGLLLDLFTGTYFGIHTLLLLLIFGFERLISHFLRGDRQRPSVIYFTVLFVVSFFLYIGLHYGLSFIIPPHGTLGNALLAEFILSGLAAFIGFYWYRVVFGKKEATNQLTLFK